MDVRVSKLSQALSVAAAVCLEFSCIGTHLLAEGAFNACLVNCKGPGMAATSGTDRTITLNVHFMFA